MDGDTHIGLLYIKTFLSSKGMESKIFDINQDIFHKDKTILRTYQKLFAIFPGKEQNFVCNVLPDKLLKLLYPEKINYPINETIMASLFEDIAKNKQKIISYKPDVIGLTINLTNVYYSCLLGRELVNEGYKVVFGGPTCIDKNIDLFLKLGVCTYIIEKEGELPFYHLLKAIENKSKEKIKKVLGLCYINESGKIVKNGPEYLKNISNLPFLDYGTETFQRVAIFGSRGCVNKCKHCSEYTYWKNYRQRPVKEIVDEMEYRIKNNGSEIFDFYDSLLNPTEKRLTDLTKEIIDRRLNIKWTCEAICRNLSKKTIILLEKSGCSELNFGIESFNDTLLELMGKRTKKEEMIRIIEDMAETNIEQVLNIIVGYPTETREMFFETIDTIMKIINDTGKFIHIIPQQFQLKLDSEIGMNPEKYNLITIKKTFNFPEEFNHLNECFNEIYAWKYTVNPTNKESYARIMFGYFLREIILKRHKDDKDGSNILHINSSDILLDKVKKIKRNKPFEIDLRISKEDLTISFGDKLLVFLNKQIELGNVFRMKRPLPPCIFEGNHIKMSKKCGAPQNCVDCNKPFIECDAITICHEKLNLFFEKEKNSEKMLEYVSTSPLDRLPKKCIKCRYRLRKQCYYVICGDRFIN